MTYNAGIEYINLKDAKYNRDKRMIKTGVKSPASVSANTVRTAPASFVANTRLFPEAKITLRGIPQVQLSLLKETYRHMLRQCQNHIHIHEHTLPYV